MASSTKIIRQFVKLRKPTIEFPTKIFVKSLGSYNMGCVNGKSILTPEDLDYISFHTALSRADVEKYHINFLEKHPDGKITKKDFNKMIVSCYPDTLEVDKLEKHIFRMYDTNGDGMIDFREFMLVLYVMSSGTPEENLSQIFKIFDIDRNGNISYKEMKRIVRDLYSLFYPNGPSEKDAEEVLAKCVFKEMDSDSDGKITREEFVAAVLAQEKFSAYLALKIIDIFVAE